MTHRRQAKTKRCHATAVQSLACGLRSVCIPSLASGGSSRTAGDMSPLWTGLGRPNGSPRPQAAPGNAAILAALPGRGRRPRTGGTPAIPGGERRGSVRRSGIAPLQGLALGVASPGRWPGLRGCRTFGAEAASQRAGGGGGVVSPACSMSSSYWRAVWEAKAPAASGSRTTSRRLQSASKASTELARLRSTRSSSGMALSRPRCGGRGSRPRGDPGGSPPGSPPSRAADSQPASLTPG